MCDARADEFQPQSLRDERLIASRRRRDVTGRGGDIQAIKRGRAKTALPSEDPVPQPSDLAETLEL
jgi:hypothetical protein